MTSKSSPITPPPELVQQWLCSNDYPWGPLELTSITITANRLQSIATAAAQWGADQELDACCEVLRGELKVLRSEFNYSFLVDPLRKARRPKPPSEADQALGVLAGLEKRCDLQCNLNTIRCALERLKKLENAQ